MEINHMYIDIGLKLCAAVGFGMLIGLERFVVKKPAGMRTYALVSMGAALFVIISELVYVKYGITAGANGFDPLRLAAQVVLGVGFLGAGMIVLQDNRVTGLTTASGLWVAAAIGTAAGFGFFSLSAIATVLTLVIFMFFWGIEERIKKVAEGKYHSEDTENEHV
ncbi:MAG: MgtC/SapB family protein [Candidatus Pacebacteria bacterium]|jgi:putative Mg2+ transporter-C (MgtC) family protein|nr:MgtC/SapB family protein [Candidatus Paceibacterota bacterium]